MEIAIIGGGITGLTAAHTLTKDGHRVTLFEKEPFLGGLAQGFRAPSWKWHMEAAYHHLFTNDHAIISLIADLGIQEKLIIKRPITSTLWNERMYQLDSPLSLFKFPGLSLIDKLRTAMVLGFLKFFPFWQLLEKITAEQLLISIGGIQAFKTIWEPLLYGKFSTFAPRVSASWFWARIVKRTPSLCYIEGGFHTLITALQKTIEAHKGTIYTSTSVESLTILPNTNIRIRWNRTQKTFDKVLLTTPTPIARHLIPSLPSSYTDGLSTIPHLHAQVLILETRIPLLNTVYWLNVTDQSYPFLAMVAHTNFMDKKQYGGNHLTYFGNYLPQGHPYLSMTKDRLQKTFMPHIKRLCPTLQQKNIIHSYLFTAPFAQPVHERGYSKKIPPIHTPIPGVYMANMDYIFPWDRGTNYAVELGQKAARAMESS